MLTCSGIVFLLIIIFIGHIVQFSRFSFTADQYKWLEGDLYNVNRNVTPWLVAVWYPPWYSTFKAQYREAECMRVEMEDLLYEHGVDIVFNGHVSVLYHSSCAAFK